MSHHSLKPTHPLRVSYAGGHAGWASLFQGRFLQLRFHGCLGLLFAEVNDGEGCALSGVLEVAAQVGGQLQVVAAPTVRHGAVLETQSVCEREPVHIDNGWRFSLLPCEFYFWFFLLFGSPEFELDDSMAKPAHRGLRAPVIGFIARDVRYAQPAIHSENMGHLNDSPLADFLRHQSRSVLGPFLHRSRVVDFLYFRLDQTPYFDVGLLRTKVRALLWCQAGGYMYSVVKVCEMRVL